MQWPFSDLARLQDRNHNSNPCCMKRELMAWSGLRADDGRSLSEPLHVHIVQRDRRGSGSGSDRAVRRKAVVRSGQEVWLWDFNRTDQQRGCWEARQVVSRVGRECALGRHRSHGVWLISLFRWPGSRCRAQVQGAWREA
jgi:hypothetical protein